MQEVKSKTADTEEEFYEQAISMLEGYGVEDPSVGESGSIPIEGSTLDQAEVVRSNVEVVDRTVTGIPSNSDRPLKQALNNLTSNQTAGGPPLRCALLPCGWLQLRGFECTSTEEEWEEPDLSAVTSPIEYPDIEVFLNPFNPRIEGETTFEIENNSDMGEHCTRTVYKCKEADEWECEPVEDSATIDSQDAGDILADAADELLDDFDAVYDAVSRNATQETNLDFRKEGALEIIKSLLDIFITGSMETEMESTLEAQTRFNGQTITETFSIDRTVRVPVENVDYSW